MSSLPRLYPIVDVDICRRAGLAPRDFARALITGGAMLLQLRAKSLPSGAFLELATAIVTDAAAAGARVIINDRADIAALAGAAGVHLGQDDLPVADVRHIVGSEAIVGLSTHSEEQLARALDDPISYVAVGPVFGTNTKDTGYDAVGLALVRTAAARAGSKGVPVVAIGGIDLARAPSVWDAGADAIAVITDLVVPDPAARVAEWTRART